MGRCPLAAGREHLQRAVVEVQMPQGTDVLGFVAADLATLPALHRALLAGTALGRGRGLRTKPCACMYRRTVEYERSGPFAGSAFMGL